MNDHIFSHGTFSRHRGRFLDGAGRLCLVGKVTPFVKAWVIDENPEADFPGYRRWYGTLLTTIPVRYSRAFFSRKVG